MASKDFTYDLLDHLKKNKNDYLLITVDRSSQNTEVELHYEAETSDSEQCIVYCVDKFIEKIKNGDLEEGVPTEIDYGWISQDELDEVLPPPEEDDEDDEYEQF